MKIKKLLYVVVSLLLFTTNIIADDITLDFEGLKNMEQVQNFYNGGTGSEGSTKGFDYNITFSANTLALIDSDAGGSGNFANEPSPNTVFFFTGNDKSIYMNVEGGFTEGFSFYYTSIQEEGDVEVWTDYNGTGKKIGSLHLDVTPSLGNGDPTGDYDNWVKKSLSFEGRAKSIVFKGVANQIGFDNISLNPRNEQTIVGGVTIAPIGSDTDTEAISHGKCNMANEFLVTLKFRTNNDLSDICDKFNFEFIGDKGGANLSDCAGKVKKCYVDKTWHPIDPNEYKLSLNFKIKKLNNGYYFKNGKLKVTRKSDGKSAIVEIWKNFNVYGTDFDILRDAFSFENGSWNEAETYYKKDGTTLKNGIATAGDVIQDYLFDNSKQQKEAFWNNIGYKNTTEVDYWFDDSVEHKSDGLCYGMAAVSAANFLHKNDPNWGMGKLSEWKNEIDSHWDKQTHKTDVSHPKPFSTNDIYNTYKRNNIQALKKLMYYFVEQDWFSPGDNNDQLDNWVGRERKLEEDENNYLKKNYPLIYSLWWKTKDIFGNKKEHGHAVLGVEKFEYGKKSKYIIVNSNKVGKYDYFYSPDDATYYYHGYKLIGGVTKDPKNDVMNIYPTFSTTTNKRSFNKFYKMQSKVNNKLAYSYPNHIKIYMVGGTYRKVTLKGSSKDIILYPLLGMPKKGKAYKKESNIFSNILLLPADKQYKLSIKKDAGFPLLKLFVTIPKKDGTAEYLVYNHAEVSEKNATFATLTVGRDNNDTVLKRENAPDYTPDEKEIYKLALLPVSSLNAIVLENEIKLMWTNPIHPTYSETVVIRKKDSKPTSITDGIEVYRGTAEEFEDTNIESNSKYYYAVYTLSKDNEPSELVWIDVDTYKYTLYGKLTSLSDVPIAGAKITLYNHNKTHIIDTAFTSKKGRFSFNGLLDGEYVLTFEHPFYKFENNEFNVTVEKKSKEVLMKAESIPNIFMEIPQTIKVGETQSIIWDGIHIDDSATVNIKLFCNNKWETIVSNVPYNKHLYKWNVTAPKGEAKLRIELDEKTFAEKDIFIFGRSELKFDFDGDGDIDLDDIKKVIKGWGSKRGEPDYNSIYDYNEDGIIDIKDIMTIASKYNL